MCEVYQEQEIQDVNLNRKTIFLTVKKSSIYQNKSVKVNPGIVI